MAALYASTTDGSDASRNSILPQNSEEPCFYDMGREQLQAGVPSMPLKFAEVDACSDSEHRNSHLIVRRPDHIEHYQYSPNDASDNAFEVPNVVYPTRNPEALTLLACAGGELAKDQDDYSAKEVEKHCRFPLWHDKIAHLCKRFGGIANCRPWCCQLALTQKPVSNSIPELEDRFSICQMMVISENGEECMIMNSKLDTGSHVSLIQRSEAEMLGWKASMSFNRLKYTKHGLTAVNGSELLPIGTMRLHMRCERTGFLMKIHFLVVEDEDFPGIDCLLSEKVIKRHHLECQHRICLTRVVRTVFEWSQFTTTPQILPACLMVWRHRMHHHEQ